MHQTLHIGDGNAIACGLSPVNVDVQITAAGGTFSEYGARARHALDHRRDLLSQFSDAGQIRAGDFNSQRRSDTCGKHVYAGADWIAPRVGEPWQTHLVIELVYQLLYRFSRGPLVTRLEQNGSFQHRKRCRIGRRIGASGLAEYALNFRQGADQAIRDLQNIGRLIYGQAGQGCWHIQQVAFIQWRHEFAAQFGQRPRHSCQ